MPKGTKHFPQGEPSKDKKGAFLRPHRFFIYLKKI